MPPAGSSLRRRLVDLPSGIVILFDWCPESQDSGDSGREICACRGWSSWREEWGRRASCTSYYSFNQINSRGIESCCIILRFLIFCNFNHQFECRNRYPLRLITRKLSPLRNLKREMFLSRMLFQKRRMRETSLFNLQSFFQSLRLPSLRYTKNNCSDVNFTIVFASYHFYWFTCRIHLPLRILMDTGTRRRRERQKATNLSRKTLSKRRLNETLPSIFQPIPLPRYWTFLHHNPFSYYWYV